MKFIDFNYQKKLNNIHFKNLKKNFSRTNFILGKEVDVFENAFAKFSNSRYAVGTSSGTDALFLALKCLNLKKNDEVIVPAHTFIATALSVFHANCKIILCDIDPKTLLIDTKKISKLITNKTKAIIPVHLYGMGVDIIQIKKIIGKRKIFIVEDSSQAHGLNHYSNKVFKGDMSIFSLYPGKNLGANGDAGIIITNNKVYYKKLKMLRNWGGVKKYQHSIIGYNMRMDTIQATILNEKLKKLKKWTSDRKKIAKFYNKKLSKIKSLNISHNFKNDHVFHLYVIICNRRDKLQKYLKSKNIETIIHYPKPIHKHLAFKDEIFFKKKFKIAEKISNECLSIPIYPGMKKNLQNKLILELSNFFNIK